MAGTILTTTYGVEGSSVKTKDVEPKYDDFVIILLLPVSIKNKAGG